MPRARNPDGTFARRADSGVPAERRADNTVQNTLTMGGVPGIDKGASFQLADRGIWIPQELDLIVRQIGLAHRICVMVADDATRAGWTVDVGEDKDVADEADEAFAIQAKVNEALWNARVYGCSLMVMAPRDPRADLSEPMKAGEQIAAIQVYDATEVFPQTWDINIRNPTGYREPESWLVTPATIASAASFTVHASRVVYVWGARQTRRVRYTTPGLRWLDMSTLELYRSALIRRERFDNSAVTLAEAMDTAIFKVPNLVQILSGPPEQALAALQRYRVLAQQSGNVGLGMIDREEEYERHPLSATGFDALEATSRRAIAEVEGIPQTKLFGDTPSGLNTDNESGRKQYAAFIDGYQSSHLLPVLRRLYAAILNVPAGQMRIRFNPIEPVSLAELADIELKLANRDVALAGAGLVDVTEVRERLAADETTARYSLDPNAAPIDIMGDGKDGGGPGSDAFQSAQNIAPGAETGSKVMDASPAQAPFGAVKP